MLKSDYRPGLTVSVKSVLPYDPRTSFRRQLGETLSDVPWRIERKNNDYCAVVRWRDGNEQVMLLRNLDII
jgi:hypothetical protein